MEDSIKIQSSTIVRRSRDVVFTQLDDELVAIDAQSGLCYALNESAGKVWDSIATPLSVAAICAGLVQEYKVDESTCLREVSAVLQNLCNAGLVQVNDVAIP